MRIYQVQLHLTQSHYLLSLIVASQYDPFSILKTLSPYLGGSASIVVHSPHVQVRNDSAICSHSTHHSP